MLADGGITVMSADDDPIAVSCAERIARYIRRAQDVRRDAAMMRAKASRAAMLMIADEYERLAGSLKRAALAAR